MTETGTTMGKSTRKKPAFVRQDAARYSRLANKWRKPKGRHSKMRLHKDGQPAVVRVGYGSDASTRGLIRGLEPVYVSTVAEVELLDGAKQVAIIRSGVGTKKRVTIVEVAEKKNVTIANLKDVAAFKEAVKQDLDSRKAKKKELVSKKQAKVAEDKKADKKESAKKQADAEKTDKEKKEEDRKEAEKVMIQK